MELYSIKYQQYLESFLSLARKNSNKSNIFNVK